MTASTPQPLQNPPAPAQSWQSPPLSNQVQVTLRPDERWLYTGKTGSGKSFLARAHLVMFARAGWRIVIVDPEGMWTGKGRNGKGNWAKTGPGTVEKPRLTNVFNKKLAVQAYVPPRIPAYHDPVLNQICVDVLKCGETIFYVDEAYSVASHTQSAEELIHLWTHGRKHDVAAHIAAQRPARIPEFFLSQAENIAAFTMKTPNDRKKLAEYTGSPEIADVILPPRYWWYSHQETMQRAQLMRPIAKDGYTVAH